MSVTHFFPPSFAVFDHDENVPAQQMYRTIFTSLIFQKQNESHMINDCPKRAFLSLVCCWILTSWFKIFSFY